MQTTCLGKPPTPPPLEELAPPEGKTCATPDTGYKVATQALADSLRDAAGANKTYSTAEGLAEDALDEVAVVFSPLHPAASPPGTAPVLPHRFSQHWFSARPLVGSTMASALRRRPWRRRLGLGNRLRLRRG